MVQIARWCLCEDFDFVGTQWTRVRFEDVLVRGRLSDKDIVFVVDLLHVRAFDIEARAVDLCSSLLGKVVIQLCNADLGVAVL